MRLINPFFQIALCFVLAVSCHSQTDEKTNQFVGGPCQGCEAVHDYGNAKLSSIDTLPDFEQSSPKLCLTGVVYKADKKTPAENVILYIYHTNREGIYEFKGSGKDRHVHLRGWVKTGKDGRYTFYTFRPAAYPSGTEAEHIHMFVKEPDKNEYYIEDYYFDDDPMLTQKVRDGLENRAGSGIVVPVEKNGMLMVERDLILGLNIPNYD